MGFTVYYRSTKPVDPETRDAVDAACAVLCGGRTWLSCEPVYFFGDVGDGHLLGGCKPNFMPHPDDVASAQSEGLPDGTLQDALDILCRLSRDHKIDWEIGHDHSDGPIGFIRDGQADADVLAQLEEIGGIGEMLGDLDAGKDFDERRDNDEFPPTIRLFRPDDD